MAKTKITICLNDHQLCNYPGCEDLPKRRGYCTKHYQSFKKREDALYRYNQPRVAGKYDEMAALYFIGSQEMEFVKIGWSTSPIDRLATMQTGCPYTMRLYMALFSRKDIIIALEWETHRALTEMGYHYRGEWFEANADDAVAVARKCADMYGLVVSDAKDAKRNMDRYYPLHGKQEDRMKAERMLDLVEGNIMLSRGMKFSLDDV